MNTSLKTRVTAVVAVVVITISLASTFLFISVQKRNIEREVIARGIALSEALSRAVDEGLAAENLNLIKYVEDIVHTKDVIDTQVFSTLWLGVASVPAGQLNDPPDPGAVEYYKTPKHDHNHFYKNKGPWIDIYNPVFLDPPDPRVPKMLIGYVRLKISTEQVRQSIREAVAFNISAAVLLALLAIFALNAIIGKYVLRPILNLHLSVSKHREGELPETVPVDSRDEIGELSFEFNQMSRALREREERLAEEKERLAVTLRSIGDAVIVTDIEGAVTLINRVAEKHTGWTLQEALGRQLSEVFHIVNEKTRKRCENPVEKVIKQGIIVGLANNTALIRRDGSEIIIEDSAAPIRDKNSVTIGVVLVFRDVTEAKKMEEELLKIEKLESIGLLAGGLAHDFNNLLTSIVGNVSLAKMYVQPGSEAHDRLEAAEAASQRATSLTYQLLTFSKGGLPVKKSTSIVDILRESAAFTLSGTAIAPEFSVSGDTWNTDIDAGQMSQVFNNLIINAVQAMPGGGKLVFAAGNVVIAEGDVPPLHEGAYVKISIQDTGTGIPDEHRVKIFDPYFTTKQKGSGLGLASAYSIIKRHDGHIAVESVPGKGTTFHIYLPASQSRSASQASEGRIMSAGSGRVLVMDDEELIRGVSGKMLRSLGYEAEFARDGDEAVEMYRKAFMDKRPFDVVILDLTIPGGLGGKDTIQKLRAVDPAVKAIVSSGYSNDPVMADYERYGFKGVMTKPYNIENFSKSLHAVINGQGAPPDLRT